MPSLRIGSATPSLKKLMKTHVVPMIVTYQSSKRKAVQGATQKVVIGKRLRRMRPTATQVNNPYFPQNDVQLLIPFLHSYQLLHPNWFWVRSYCLRHLIRHQLDIHQLIPKKSRFWLKQQMFPKWQKMWVLSSYPWCYRSIFFQKFLILFNFYSWSDFLPC